MWKEIKPDYEALMDNLRRTKTPKRVHFMELSLDAEIQNALINKFGLAEGLPKDDPYYSDRLQIRLHRFLGYDCIFYGLAQGKGFPVFPRPKRAAEDTGGLKKAGGRQWTEEHHGPIQTWEDFEKYPWPDPGRLDTSILEWYSKNLPDDMCMFAKCHQVFEQVTWLMGYESMCLAFHDQPDLVDAMFEKVGGIFYEFVKILVQFDRMKIFFGGDDMGFKTGTLIDPKILIEKAIPWHNKMAQLVHRHDGLYLLHSCGDVRAVMPALIDAGIDGKHAFEDSIQPITEAKKLYGDKIALIGGMDIDFLCRSSEKAIRARVREVLDRCLPGGGYCLGTGNSVTNYIPLDHFLAMMEEGRNYGI
jgi:uroporphyrinogen decarboxylase